MIKNISFKFHLFDASNQPINEMPVNIQYFNMQENQWISIYNDVIKEGKLIIEEKATSRAKALKLFLDKIKVFEIPELRIIPEKQIFDVKKQEVLSITYEFELLQEESQLNFNFGSAWLLDKELLIQNDRYKNFFWITSPFSLVNQKENLAKNSELELNLTACNNRNTELDKTNKTLELSLQNINNQFQNLIIENQANINLIFEIKIQLESQTKELSLCRKEFEKQQKNYSKLNEDFETHKVQRLDAKKEFENQINQIQKEYAKKEVALKDLKQQLDICTMSRTDLEEKFKSQIATLENKFAIKQNEFSSLQDTYNELKANYDNQINCIGIKKEFEECQDKLFHCQDKYKTLEIVWQNSKINTTTLTKLNQDLLNDQEALNTTISNLNKEIFSLQKSIEELSKVIKIEDRPVAINAIYKNLVEELDIASELSKTNNYSLSNLSVKLKGVINQDTNNTVGIQLFSKENAKQINGNAISDISFDIIPSPSQNPKPGITPDVLGLTETAVTRILESLGLKLNPVYQKSDKPNGASFKQAPQSGSLINLNEFVTVIFSKNA